MIQLNQRYAVHLCDSFVELSVRPAAMDAKNPASFYIVDLAIRDPKRAARKGDILIELRDSSGRALSRTFSNASCPAPVVVRKAGIASEHYVEVFAPAQDQPATLYLRLFGQSVELPLTPEPKGKKGDAGKGDAGKGERDGGPGDEELRKKKGPRCCPDAFVTPAGNQPTLVRNLPGGRQFLCRPWTITATFNAAPSPPCRCVCCEYRQDVRGESDLRIPLPAPLRDIIILPLSPPLSKPVPIPGTPLVFQIPATIGPEFQEDTLYVNPLLRYAYGHRNEKGTPAFDTVDQDYPIECEYWGWDGPRIELPAFFLGTAWVLHVDWEFRGRIIDACEGGDKESRLWQWRTDSVL